MFVFFFKQKTAYELRISDWSSDVCSSDLCCSAPWRSGEQTLRSQPACDNGQPKRWRPFQRWPTCAPRRRSQSASGRTGSSLQPAPIATTRRHFGPTWSRNTILLIHMTGSTRSEEHTSELQSLMRISYAVFCLKQKKKNTL